jgi:hypothetical protein
MECVRYKGMEFNIGTSINIIKGICEMALDGGTPLGVGRDRIAYRDRWGVVG